MTGLDGDGGDGGDGTSVRPQAMGSVCRLLKVSVCSCVHTVSSCPVISSEATEATSVLASEAGSRKET